MTKTSTGHCSTGHYSTGDRSTGDRSTGDYSTGHYSTGHRSTGDRSTGDRSTGDYSTGHYSTGDRSTGHYSTGHCSTGDRSTGDYSTGDRSTGDRSTGDRSTGHCSISKYSSGHFSTIDFAGYGWFNKPCEKLWEDVDTPNFNEFQVAFWIEESNMTNKEKEENPTYKTTEGFLKSVDYKTAWTVFWRKTSEENKKKFLALPNFCTKVFEEITGINVEQEEMVEITIGEKTFKISRKSADELKRNL